MNFESEGDLLPEGTADEGFIYVDYEDECPNSPFMLPLLKKRGRVWQVGFDGTSLIMSHGVDDGKIREDRTVVVTNSSGRTLYEQAWLEAKYRYHRKTLEGYARDGALRYNEPQLAKPWDPTKRQIKNWPVLVQPKIDGLRLLASVGETGEIELKTRKNKYHPHLQHIRTEVMRLMSYLPPEMTLDGEIWSPNLSFQEITSIGNSNLIKRDPREELLQYHVFDIADGGQFTTKERVELLEYAFICYERKRREEYLTSLLPFLKDRKVRKTILEYVYSDVICLVKSEYARSPEEVLELHSIYTSKGYEGVMLRETNAFYQEGRRGSLYKYKDFYDDEGKIVDVHAAAGNQEGAIIFEVEYRGKRFRAVPKMSIEERRRAYAEKETYLGKLVTFKYQGLTKDGIPRFPVCIGVRDYE